jgi:hypothetical protein
MQKIVPLVLLLLVGCGGSSTPEIPPTTGDFVKNNNGVGTAQVFGIDFRVSVNSGGASTEDSIAANFVAAEQSSARKRFTFGDDITIQLDSVNQAEVGFIFNGQNFGNLNVGDEVVIDDERHVQFNATPRLPMSAS